MVTEFPKVPKGCTRGEGKAMASDRHTTKPGPAKRRYEEFAEKNRKEDRRVKESIDRIGETAKKLRRARNGGTAA